MKNRLEHIFSCWSRLLKVPTLKYFLFFFVINNAVHAQHYQFSQFYAASTYLNPAFTGVNACSKVGVVYRDQWPSIPGAFTTYQMSFEHYASEINSGFGASFFNDKSGYGGLRTSMYSFLYAYQAKLNRKYVIRFGLQAGVVQRSVNYESLLFGDQIARGGALTTLETPTQSVSYMDFSSGVLLHSKNTWLGMSAIHLNQPNQSLLENGQSDLPWEGRIHGGTKKYFNEELIKDDLESITIAFNYKFQAKYDQADVGFYYTKLPFVVGVWYRGIPLFKAYQPGYSNNDAVCLLAGFVWDKFTFGYSYDITISKLTYRSGGANEISLSYQFCDYKKSKKKKPVLIFCPKF